MKINKILFAALGSVVLFTACSTTQPQTSNLDEKTEYELKQEAKKAIQSVAGKLQMALYEKVKEGGITNAATFCSTNATSLAKEASKSLPKGIKLKRITDKPRNAMSMANEEQLAVFEEMKEKMENGEKFDMIVKQKSENHFQVYKPIKISGACLKCHGTEETRNKEAYEIISKKYPNDKAIDYKLYDFRGAFLVDIVK